MSLASAPNSFSGLEQATPVQPPPHKWVGRNDAVDSADLPGNHGTDFSSSFSPVGLSDSFSLLKAIQGVRPEDAAENSPLSPLPSQPLEIGYLNVASPGDTTDCHKEEEEQPSCSDEV